MNIIGFSGLHQSVSFKKKQFLVYRPGRIELRKGSIRPRPSLRNQALLRLRLRNDSLEKKLPDFSRACDPILPAGGAFGSEAG